MKEQGHTNSCAPGMQQSIPHRPVSGDKMLSYGHTQKRGKISRIFLVIYIHRVTTKRGVDEGATRLRLTHTSKKP